MHRIFGLTRFFRLTLKNHGFATRKKQKVERFA